ncbi:unnamed protein product [Paramecium pentaurelia]|uniref:Uncharacterized protein n=1 Tax=Paramecium pentaurelia TaxID=43138 RepID=A0A8S1X3K8_9CILI|nr:unnamed protein product [Paramecium pentaurelia]
MIKFINKSNFQTLFQRVKELTGITVQVFISFNSQTLCILDLEDLMILIFGLMIHQQARIMIDFLI